MRRKKADRSQKPRLGLILLRAEWFDSVVGLPALTAAVAADKQEIESFLGSLGEISKGWVVNSPASLDICREELIAGEFDLILLAFQVWAEDYFLNPLLEALGDRPLLVWCYLPWNKPLRPISFTEVLRASGPVGTFEGLGTLRNLGQKFFFTQGPSGDPKVRSAVLAAARAGRVLRGLRHARFGLLPARNEQMQSTFVDEFRLTRDWGPQVKHLSVGELKQRAIGLSLNEVDAYCRQLREEYPVREVEPVDLEQAARASLALAHLAVDHNLDVLALEDILPELHTALGLRPCLYPALVQEAGSVLSLEGDLGAATAMYILHQLAGDPLVFLEFWFWDEPENCIVGGHAGVQNPAAAAPGSAWISQDFEFAQSDALRGAHYQFVAKPGRVTLLQLRCTPQGWQGLLACGEAIETAPWLEGYPHAVIRLDVPIDSFVRRAAAVGSTQHWIMGYGEHRDEIRYLFEWLGFPLEDIQ